MNGIKTFRDLVAWQKGMELCRLVYRETKNMPSDERFGLINQMRRAAVSVPSNIAEGYGRQSRDDYLRFLRITRGSLAELTTQYELATTMDMISCNQQFHDLLAEVDRILQGLIRSVANANSL